MALLWAGGILWLAYDFAGSAQAGHDSNSSANDDAAIAAALN